MAANIDQVQDQLLTPIAFPGDKHNELYPIFKHLFDISRQGRVVIIGDGTTSGTLAARITAAEARITINETDIATNAADIVTINAELDALPANTYARINHRI